MKNRLDRLKTIEIKKFDFSYKKRVKSKQTTIL